MFDDCFKDSLVAEGVSEDSGNDAPLCSNMVFVVASNEVLGVN